MKKVLLAKSALLLGVVLATMPAAEARGGFRGGVIVRPYVSRPYFGAYYGPFGYGYPGYYGGYYGGFGFPGNAHRNQGKLNIDTKQKDAQVYIDGAFAGMAKDMKSTWLKQGTYDLELRAPGGERYAQQIYVVSGKTIRVRPELPADSHS